MSVRQPYLQHRSQQQQLHVVCPPQAAGAMLTMLQIYCSEKLLLHRSAVICVILTIWSTFHLPEVVVNIGKTLPQALVRLMGIKIFAVICNQTVKIQLGLMVTNTPVLIVLQKC